MDKKRKTKKSGNDEIVEMVKKVKSAFFETVVSEWLYSPEDLWGGKTPIEMIKNGEGQKVLDAIDQAHKELKMERKTKNKTEEKIVEERGERTIHVFI